ncbi:MAG TPA: glucoamylase family protein [Rhodanobacteraceae bacterium]
MPPSGAVDLETCARDLARRQAGMASRQNIPDLRRALLEHERSLRRAYAAARLAVSEQRRIEPAAEWLLDNFHLVRTQLRELALHLPLPHLRKLPRVGAADECVPRMLAIARACVANLDGRIEPEHARRFLAAYQDQTTLTLGELWSLPDLLRMALAERIAAGARVIATRLEEYARAEYWAGYLIEKVGQDAAGMLMYVADMARLVPAVTPAWTAEFYRLLEGKHPSLAIALTWAEQQLHQRGLSVAEVIDEESRAQAADQVSIANCINSLRLVARHNWSDVIEAVSAVDRILASDPAHAYLQMDFTTRGSYRRAVEVLAMRARTSETEIAERAVEAAYAAESPTRDPRVRHVGHHLIGRGRAAFEKRLQVTPPPEARMATALRRWPAAFYLGAIALVTAAITFGAGHNSVHGLPLPLDITLLVALFIGASHPAVAMVNWLMSMLVPPELLPRMSFSGGIPDDCRTLVVVPWLLGSEAGLDEQLDLLEIRYLGNRDPNLHFALLTDFPDAPMRDMPQDAALLAAAVAGIERLNEKYPLPGSTRFHLFHRPREWNERERAWMGFERKRGKLGELNRVLRNGDAENFSTIVGDLGALQGARYVITLDADTMLPPQAARRLIETMAHPLNRPWFHKGSRRVIAGFGILQPRVSVNSSPGRASRFSRLFADDSGLDPYTHAVSDVYQDLFGEASFVGKGIYDIDAFSRSVGTRFPNDLILSHDLLEGSYARTGVVSDVELIEHQPNRYSVEARRRHRWTRGDWQIVQWLLPIVPGPRRRGLRNMLKGHHRWKILDNLRRGLVPIAMLVLLLRGWTLAPRPLYWTLLAIAFLLAPPLFIALAQMARNALHRAHSRHWRDSLRGAADQLLRTGFALAVIPFEAFLNLDAILRSAGRLLFTRRRLLEWTTMEHATQSDASAFREFARLMWVAPTTAVVGTLVLWTHAPGALVAAAPFLVLWFFAPAIAAWLSHVPHARGNALDAHEQRFLGGIARRTWHWFETFVNAEENWLPPDNYQEYPAAQVAHRTSPTNIGMALLANLTAHDFGYIGVGELLARTRNTLATLAKLSCHRGHFYNWYDTQSLAALPPHYISTVDSGNLMGCFAVLGCALRHLRGEPLVPTRLAQGLADTAQIVGDCVRAAAIGEPHAMLALTTTLAALDTLVEHARVNRDALPVLHGLLARIENEAANLAQLAAPLTQPEELKGWIAILRRQSGAALNELEELAPWLTLGDSGSDDQRVRELLRELECNPPQARALAIAGEVLERLRSPGNEFAHDKSCLDLCAALEEMCATLRARHRSGRELAARCRELGEMDLGFLWDRSLQQFSIGYVVEHNRLDTARYDLLASEARLASYIAVAQDQVPASHWFALGRLLTRAAGRPALVSWSGSMFEYLMPQLLMPGFAGSLLDASCRAAVAAQIAYGVRQEAPWGISESAYNVTDAHLNYQYRAFGVPGLGLKQGLGDDLVIAPYACTMALMLEPEAAVRNLQALRALGALTRYGFYEALDYTEGRVAPGQPFAMVRTFMAHHHGMSFLALSNLLHDAPMQKRFMHEPMFRAYELLLREKVPAVVPVRAAGLEAEPVQPVRAGAQPAVALIARMDTAIPRVHLLSNGRYHVLLTQTGAGYSAWRDVFLTRWSGDGTRDADGQFCYLRDVESGQRWSATFQPCPADGAEFSATFSQARAEFRRVDYGIECEMRVAVSAEDDVELRRVRLTNRSSRPRTLEITSYAELALNTRAVDAAHPAFSKLFVQTELLPGLNALLASRRPRGADESNPWLLHQMNVRGEAPGSATFETDRARFLGRLREATRAQAIENGGPLSDSAGAVLDPCMAIRRRVQIAPGRSVSIDLVTGVAPTREAARTLAGRYREKHLHERVFELAWTHEQVVMQQLNVGARDTQLYERIAARLLYPGGAPRAGAPIGLPTQSALWKHGISGDLPIVLVRIANSSQLDLVRQLIKAHGWWQSRGLQADLLIWNEELSGYRQELQDHILYLISSSLEARNGDGAGRMYAWRIEHLSSEDRALMMAVARCVFSGNEGRLRDQIARMAYERELASPAPTPQRKAHAGSAALQPPADLRGFNGIGGHSPDGREYVMWLPGGVTTPAPWCNVLANEKFGSVVSESGSAYSFAGNAHEFRLTPWRNDPLTDASGEAFWLRDEENGEFWSPAPLPTRSADPYLTAHGFGYTRYRHAHADIVSEVTAFVAREAPLKLTLLKLRNAGPRARRISVTGYVEWVLGERRARSAPQVHTRLDPLSGALLAGNFYDDVFSSQIAFHALCAQPLQRSGDRRTFIGRNRDLSAPLGMLAQKLDGEIGAGLDPCSAQRAEFELQPGTEMEVVFALGACDDVEQVRALIRDFGHPLSAREELQRVCDHWRAQLDQLVVRTPEAEVNLLANGWLVYQTMAARLFARSGYYQSGGAWGFRDQLQDSMALVHTRPDLARAQLLRAAGRQFREGDVQHWWHPPSGRGVRTRISDDFLWLPRATTQYIAISGDAAVLDETAPFIEGRPLAEDEESSYDVAHASLESASLYEHCARALEHGLRFGAHGLPLIGSGDWNDGMNRVGHLGRGESVWLAFFLHDVLGRLIPFADARADHERARGWREAAAALAQAIERHGWDGAWYLRAYFDDGTPLGSKSNDECRIDSLPQSWAVLSGAADPVRATRGLDAALRMLVRDELGLVQLFDPPFDVSTLDPGYIKGYVPGVRENGGQYTHAAVWLAMALAQQGRVAEAWRIARLLNPLNHARTRDEVARYMVEPYVLAADVYMAAGHAGRGGWTWYTGSAGWMYRLLIESLLGVQRRGDMLSFAPCVPEDWRSWELDYRHGQTLYRVMFERVAPGSVVAQVLCDGALLRDGSVPLRDDGREHLIEVRVGRLAAGTAELIEKGSDPLSSPRTARYARIEGENDPDPFSEGRK